MEYHPTYTIYLNRSNPKILQFQNCVSFQESINSVTLLNDPYEGIYEGSVQVEFDFVIHDYAPISKNQYVAVSREGWLGVYFQNVNNQVVQSNSFQLYLEDGELVDCMVAVEEYKFICVAVSKNGKASRLIFCEIVGDYQLYLIQGGAYNFESSRFNKRPGAIKRLSTDFWHKGNCLVLAFEGCRGGGVFCMTVSQGGVDIIEEHYTANLFEGEFRDYSCHNYCEIWTLDSQNIVKKRTKDQILGNVPIFNSNSPIISDDEEDEVYQTQHTYEHSKRAIRGKWNKLRTAPEFGTIKCIPTYSEERKTKHQHPDDNSEEKNPNTIKLQDKNDPFPANKDEKFATDIKEELYTDQITGIIDENERFEDDHAKEYSG